MASPNLSLVGVQQAARTAIEQGVVNNVTVSISPINPSDQNAEYTDLPNTEIFTDYVIQNYYERDGHRYMAGITTPGSFQGGTVAFFQLANLTLLWISDWTAQKIGGVPEIPDPTVSDSNWVLLDTIAQLDDIKFKPDGITPIYRVTGTYVYGHKNPASNFTAHMRFGESPEFSASPIRTIPADKLKTGINFTAAGGGAGAQPGNPNWKGTKG